MPLLNSTLDELVNVGQCASVGEYLGGQAILPIVWQAIMREGIARIGASVVGG